jgi:hypothetical protein
MTKSEYPGGRRGQALDGCRTDRNRAFEGGLLADLKGSAAMQRIRALLVYADAEPLRSLKLTLQGLPVEIDQVHTCQQARNSLKRAIKRPDIVFTDTALPDGTWRDLLSIARIVTFLPRSLSCREPRIPGCISTL